MKKMVGAALILVLFLISSSQIEGDAADCYDGCSTACVQRDSRLTQRCDRKCSIRCGPDSAVVKDPTSKHQSIEFEG